MQGQSTAMRIMTSIAYQSPTILVFMIGMIIALFLMRKHPKISMFALVGFLILSLATVGGIALNHFLIGRMISGESTREQYETLSKVSVIGTALFRTLGYAFVVLAIFLGRSPKVPDREYAPPPTN